MTSMAMTSGPDVGARRPTVEVALTAVAAGGDALGRLPSNKVVFVEGALPGEVVVAEIVEDRHDFARARAIEVVTAASSRVEPSCPGVAAGCGWLPVAARGASGPARLQGLHRRRRPGPNRPPQAGGDDGAGRRWAVRATAPRPVPG